MKYNKNYLQQLRTINELAQRIDALPDILRRGNSNSNNFPCLYIEAGKK